MNHTQYSFKPFSNSSQINKELEYYSPNFNKMIALGDASAEMTNHHMKNF